MKPVGLFPERSGPPKESPGGGVAGFPIHPVYLKRMTDQPRCDCGAVRKPPHRKCFDCARKDAEAEGRLCECGKFKKAGFPHCLDCAREAAKREDRLCECGNFKSAGFPKCRKCTFPGSS